MADKAENGTTLRKRGKHYTTLDNQTLKEIKNADALAIWAYLMSQSDGFKIIKSHLRSHLDMSELRVERAFRYLKDLGLYKVNAKRSEDGRSFAGSECEIFEKPQVRHVSNKAPLDQDVSEKEALISNQEVISNQEENKEPQPAATQPASLEKSRTFKDHTAVCKEANVPRINASKIDKYATSVGLPELFVDLSFMIFEQRYMESKKKYTDWTGVFLNAIKGNWYHLWFIADNGDYCLTTAGKQALAELKGNA